MNVGGISFTFRKKWIKFRLSARRIPTRPFAVFLYVRFDGFFFDLLC